MDERNDYDSIPIQHTQTAVEWLVEQCPRIETTVAYHVLEQAKKKEKDWLIHTYWVAYTEGRYDGDLTAEQYYKETFKK